MTLTDSGYTEDELDTLFAELTAGEDLEGEAALGLALALGLADGDLVALSERGTVMLNTPRATLDANIATVRTLRAQGHSLTDAVNALPAP
jgi:hypothetical protein